MSKLVVTNIRLTKEELMEYRQMALHEGKSFSEYLRAILEQFAHQKKIGGKVDASKIDVGKKRSDEPIWSLKGWNSGIVDGAKNHDKYIY